MNKMNKNILLAAAILMALASGRVAAQNFDTSGTAGLTGPYLFRYVTYFNDQFGNLTESCTLSGVITFDGLGNYSTAGAQLVDSASPGSCTSLQGGTYGVQSNGIAQLDNPLNAAIPGTLFGTFSQPVLTASTTEDDFFDLFIAVQAPSAASSNASLSGAFTVGTLDYLDSSSTLARQGYFTLNADGNGNIAPFSVAGSAANLTPAAITQNVAASTYALSGAAGGVLTLPGAYGDQTQIVSGAKLLYVSADGNYVLGGSPTGSDMIFGFRAPSGSSSNSLLSGTYFMAGLENDVSTGFLDAFYGSINTNGDGTLIWHERFDQVVEIYTQDYTFNTSVTLGANGSYFDGSVYTYLAGANGTALMLIGSDPEYSLNVGVHAPTITPTSSVWIDPTYITNAANYTPITNAYAPGELVSLYGNFGVSSQSAEVLPIPTTLGGVQVLVNGRAAPVFLVSANQVSALIPYEISGDFFATFQVVVAGSKSNTVTVYVDNSAPGIYTLAETGLGDGAILHANYTLVNTASPAVPGETVLLFMNGLGTVTPPVGDGVAASNTTLSNSDEGPSLYVYLDDGVNTPALANIYFAGLAPGFAGLYQVNFTLPTTGLANGEVYLGFGTNEAYNDMATIPVSGFPADAFRPASPHRAIRPPVIRGTAVRARNMRDRRRALPRTTPVNP